MTSPTVLVGLDALGGAVLDRVARSLAEDDPMVRYLRGPMATIEAQMVAALDALLRAGGGGASDDRKVRLDVLVFADVLAGERTELASLCARLTAVVSDRYGVMFPPGLPPEQRNAALHVVAVVPALGGQPEAVEALARLGEVEALTGGGGYALLARVWLLSRHSTAGTLSHDGLVASAAAFAVAAIELRTAGQVSQRLAHLDGDEGRFGLLAVASLEVPEAGLRRYARERAAYDGLVTLVSRVTRQVTDGSLADQAVSGVEASRWLAPFESGEVAQRSRQVAAARSGAALSLPEQMPVGPFDDAALVRQRYAVLFGPAAQVSTPSVQDAATLDELLRALGRAEADAMASIAGGVSSLLDTTLGPPNGLRRLPEVELGLKRLLATLRDAEQAHRTSASRALGVGAAAVTTTPEPHRDELEGALAALPSKGLLRGVAGAVGVGASALALGVLLRVLTPATATGAAPAPSASITPGAVTTASTVSGASVASPPQAAPWGGAIVVGLVAGAVWARWAGGRARSELRRLLVLRRDALAELWQAGGGGRQQAEAQLGLRQRRVRRAALAAVEQALQRLGALVAALIDRRDRAVTALGELGLKVPAASAAADELTGLLGEGDGLHEALVPGGLLAGWVARRRQITDPDLWADRLVEQTWPAGGLSEDVPVVDAARLEALCRWQVTPLIEQSMLADPEIAQAAARTVTEFVGRVATALGPPVIPRTVEGDPAPGLRPGEIFAVAPQAGAADLDEALRRSPFTLPVLWSPSRGARVLIFRTWEAQRLDDIARGARVALPAGGAR